MPQFRALAYLDRCPGESLSAVADHLGVTLSTASTIADRLVRHGFVERTPHPEERRKITLTITPAGLQLLLVARAATRARVAEILVDLSPVQLRTIVEGLGVLSEAFKSAAPEKRRGV